MDKFEALFGIEKEEVHDTCILMPLLSKHALEIMGISRFSKGRLYNSGKSRYFTLINTRVGHSFVADAVLYLKETSCRRIILFGSCGLTREGLGLRIGSVVTPYRCYERESFSQMLLDNKVPKLYYPDREFLAQFLEINKEAVIQKVTCSTLGSLKLEETMQDVFIRENIEVVDMECSAFFSAAESASISALALFYISDIIHKKPFYFPLDTRSKKDLDKAIKKASIILCDFIKENSSVSGMLNS
ncbi:MAG: hypothetical protein ABIG46_03420 [Candidatus Omnitrophota bacterium]|nr:hypothetical protein [Candidatus Omnitrophota bacterium]